MISLILSFRWWTEVSLSGSQQRTLRICWICWVSHLLRRREGRFSVGPQAPLLPPPVQRTGQRPTRPLRRGRFTPPALRFRSGRSPGERSTGPFPLPAHPSGRALPSVVVTSGQAGVSRTPDTSETKMPRTAPHRAGRQLLSRTLEACQHCRSLTKPGAGRSDGCRYRNPTRPLRKPDAFIRRRVSHPRGGGPCRWTARRPRCRRARRWRRCWGPGRRTGPRSSCRRG